MSDVEAGFPTTIFDSVGINRPSLLFLFSSLANKAAATKKAIATKKPKELIKRKIPISTPKRSLKT